MNYAEESLKKHAEWKGKIEIVTRCPVKTKDDLSLAYTPGVAQPCLEIQKDINKSYELTRRWNTCLVVTDGTAVLGLGDIGPEAGHARYGRQVRSVQGVSVTSMRSRSASSPRMSTRSLRPFT